MAAVVGAIWGLAGYAILWGHTSVVLHRPFVVSALGTVLLLPIRVVLWGIRWVEEGLGRAPFDFSANNAWIGVLAGLVGAGIAGGVTLAAAAVVQAVRRSSQTADRP